MEAVAGLVHILYNVLNAQILDCTQASVKQLALVVRSYTSMYC